MAYVLDELVLITHLFDVLGEAHSISRIFELTTKVHIVLPGIVFSGKLSLFLRAS